MSDYVIVPVSPVAAQSFATVLSGQSLTISLRQRSTGLYMDIYRAGTLVVAGILCQNRTWIVRKAYIGLPGDLAFIDTEGTADPTYSTLGSRFILIYQEAVNG